MTIKADGVTNGHILLMLSVAGNGIGKASTDSFHSSNAVKLKLENPHIQKI